MPDLPNKGLKKEGILIESPLVPENSLFKVSSCARICASVTLAGLVKTT